MKVLCSFGIALSLSLLLISNVLYILDEAFYEKIDLKIFSPMLWSSSLSFHFKASVVSRGIDMSLCVVPCLEMLILGQLSKSLVSYNLLCTDGGK